MRRVQEFRLHEKIPNSTRLAGKLLVLSTPAIPWGGLLGNTAWASTPNKWGSSRGTKRAGFVTPRAAVHPKPFCLSVNEVVLLTAALWSHPRESARSQLDYRLAPVQRQNFLIPREEFKALGPAVHIHCLTRCLFVSLPQGFSIPRLCGRKQVRCPSRSSEASFLAGTRDTTFAPSPKLFWPLSGFSISSPKWHQEVTLSRWTPAHPKAPPPSLQPKGWSSTLWQGCWCDKRCLRRQLFISMVTPFLLLFMFIRMCTCKSGLFISIHANNYTILSPSPVSPRN